MNQCTTQIPNFSPACDLCEQTQGGNKEVTDFQPLAVGGPRGGGGKNRALWLATVKAKETKSR